MACVRLRRFHHRGNNQKSEDANRDVYTHAVELFVKGREALLRWFLFLWQQLSVASIVYVTIITQT